MLPRSVLAAEATPARARRPFNLVARLAAAAMVAIAVPTVPAPAAAETSAHDDGSAAREARALLAEASRLERQRKVGLALQAARAAYQRDPRPLYLADLARLEEASFDVAGAYRDYERFMEECDDAPAAKRDEATRALRRLSLRVSWISVETDEPGAPVAVDDEAPVRTPATVVVTPGHHKVALLVAGRSVAVRDIEVAVTQTAAVRLTAPPPDAPAPAPAPRVSVTPAPAQVLPVVPREEASSAGPWVAWSVTAALGIAAGVATGVALERTAEFDARRETFGVSRAELDAAHGQARAWTVAAGVLGGAALVGATVASVLTFKPAQEKSPSIAVGPGFVTLRGTL